MGVTAGLKLRTILDNVSQILALELFAAAQGIDFRRQELGSNARLGRGTAPVYNLIRQHVPFVAEDTFLHPYITTMCELVAQGKIAAAGTGNEAE
jgi:histidine ammonia-lyase